MEKIWLERYPEGVPAEINPDAYASVAAVMESSCRKFANQPAFTNFGTTITFKQLDEQARHFAAYLQQGLGLAPGSRIALMMPNTLQYPIALVGALRAGMVIVNVNPMYTQRELEHQLHDGGADLLVVVANFAHVASAALHKTEVRHVIVTEVGDLLGWGKSTLVNLWIRYVRRELKAFSFSESITFREVLNRGSKLDFKAPEIKGDDLAFLQYTGGTTGVAKGAMLTHRNMVANIEQVAAWIRPSINPGSECVITALPLYHIFCLTANCLTFIKFGGHGILITDPRDMKGFVRELGKHKFTAITGVNTLFNGLLNTPGFADLDFSSMRISLGGGMAVQRAVAEKWKAVTGKALLEGYGLTECSPVATVNPIDLDHYSGSIGLPVSSTDVSLRDDNGIEVEPGSSGELWVRGPQVMRGYWNNPEATARNITPDGWLKTGDIAVMDETGFLRIVDRKKDMILVSGFNVYPNEIEEVLVHHEGILEAACVGVDDEHSGEAVKVVIVTRPGVTLTREDVRSFCKQSLTNYKVPRIVEFRDNLPKSNVGKILRRELKEPL